MSLGVLNNISAVYAENNLNQTQNSLQKTLQQPCRHMVANQLPQTVKGRRQELHQRLAAGASKAQVAREFGISRETLYQYLQMMA